MPSTTPPTVLHYPFGTGYSPATAQDGFVPAYSEGERFHEPAAIYDTTSSLDSHASSRHQNYVPTDRISFPSSLSVTRHSQQPIPRTAPYSSRMSGHPPWGPSNYVQWQSASSSSFDANAPSFASSQIAHKVWLLVCKHCRSFLTNRGMKAVLLLRPHVPLYSTDALPVNCSAVPARPSSTSSPRQQPNEQQPRTCDCLTQTLCCHGCGTGVGYMIVAPCARCTTSSSAMNRVTNGHRFVFHSSELMASERRYMPGERGILPAYAETSSSSPTSSRSLVPSTPDSSTASPTLTSSYSTTPPLATESPCPVPSSITGDPHKPSPQPLRAGDILYWHHLTQSGEIPGAMDDPRARGDRLIVYDR
ncbi:FAM72 protein-domain-containing protein [Russula earlei]|uniref:FAM72 protein-domain-containing protein n=1 Tax=Russula earlei TaxID=71964 RepID=A0ACC0UCC6_9AGAM|nr:FAM72 protein-domain-containing protein [Russula earlei]